MSVRDGEHVIYDVEGLEAVGLVVEEPKYELVSPKHTYKLKRTNSSYLVVLGHCALFI